MIQVTKKISTDTPSSQLVDAYLGEIAKGYGINWTPALPSHDDDNSGNDGGVKVSAATVRWKLMVDSYNLCRTQPLQALLIRLCWMPPKSPQRPEVMEHERRSYRRCHRQTIPMPGIRASQRM